MGRTMPDSAIRPRKEFGKTIAADITHDFPAALESEIEQAAEQFVREEGQE